MISTSSDPDSGPARATERAARAVLSDMIGGSEVRRGTGCGSFGAKGRLLAAAMLVAQAGTPAAEAAAENNRCTLQTGSSQAVVRVIDAETISMDDGSEVRLVGALAPHAPSGTPNSAPWPPLDAAKRALEKLVLGRAVELAYAGHRRDRYGRRLAHVFVTVDGERVWVQGRQLSEGHARAYALPGNTACVGELLTYERAAIEGRRGLWANPVYRVREALNPRDLLARVNRFEVVSGRVHAVSETSQRIYLNFGPDWRHDFTASLPAARLKSASGKIESLKTLEGKRVRVRGWIERRNGPMIEIADPSEIEVEADQEPLGGGAPPENEKGPAHVAPDPIDL